MTKRELNEKITRLEKFVAEHLQGLQKQVDGLREAGSETWERLDSRTKDLEDFCTSMRDMIRAIIKHLHIPYETMRRLLKEVDAEWHTDKYSDLPGTKDLGGELEKKAALFDMAEAQKPEREVIRMKDAHNLLGHHINKGFDFMRKNGLEGYREGRRKCFIYVDSVPKFLENMRKRPHSRPGYSPKHPGMVLLQTAANRANIGYTKAVDLCESMGIVCLKDGTHKYITEGDSARLVLKVRI